MSNEFVMVPRKWAEHYADLLEEYCTSKKAEQVTAYLAKPAEQHQGEPVALPERKGTHLHYDTLMPTFSKGWNACLDEIAKLGPLYTRPVQGEPVAWKWTQENGLTLLTTKENSTFYEGKGTFTKTPLYAHADPGEVERLRAELETMAADRDAEKAMKAKAREQRDRVSAQLAEAHTLLREIKAGVMHKGWVVGVSIPSQIDSALSASAEPSAPSEPKCKYCGDTGQIMVGRSGDANDGNAPIMEPCEDCDGSGSSGGQMHSNGIDAPEYEPFKCETCSGFGIVGNILNAETCTACTPSAPVESDERAEFEKAWAGAVNVEVLDLHRKQFPLTSDADQPYDTPQTQLAWMMWQARAALGRKP